MYISGCTVNNVQGTSLIFPINFFRVSGGGLELRNRVGGGRGWACGI